ncbi:hypothetical protein SMICM304S_09213 [Streptomyces microflavus]
MKAWPTEAQMITMTTAPMAVAVETSSSVTRSQMIGSRYTATDRPPARKPITDRMPTTKPCR